MPIPMVRYAAGHKVANAILEAFGLDVHATRLVLRIENMGGPVELDVSVIVLDEAGQKIGETLRRFCVVESEPTGEGEG